MKTNDAVALIPLRAGGKRVGLIDGLDKERAMLGKHPLMAYTIRWAIDSGLFEDVIVVTRSWNHAAAAKEYGASVPFERPEHTVYNGSPDIDWVLFALNELRGESYDIYSILRVTSPFRTSDDMEQAYNILVNSNSHSVRMVTPVSDHPAKMWVIRQNTLLPLLPVGPESSPWHSNPTQNSFECYKQTAGMEMAWVDMTLDTRTIAGSIISPYITRGLATLDINTRYDWSIAEDAIKEDLVVVPESLK